VHNVKSGLSTRVVQALGGSETLAMVEHYSKSLQFSDALALWKANGSHFDNLSTKQVVKARLFTRQG